MPQGGELKRHTPATPIWELACWRGAPITWGGERALTRDGRARH
jgi:hypothetical protein